MREKVKQSCKSFRRRLIFCFVYFLVSVGQAAQRAQAEELMRQRVGMEGRTRGENGEWTGGGGGVLGPDVTQQSLTRCVWWRNVVVCGCVLRTTKQTYVAMSAILVLSMYLDIVDENHCESVPFVSCIRCKQNLP